MISLINSETSSSSSSSETGTWINWRQLVSLCTDYRWWNGLRACLSLLGTTLCPPSNWPSLAQLDEIWRGFCLPQCPTKAIEDYKWCDALNARISELKLQCTFWRELINGQKFTFICVYWLKLKNNWINLTSAPDCRFCGTSLYFKLLQL